MKVLIVSPFRKGKLIESVVSNIENYEVVNTAPLQLCTLLKSQGYEVAYLSLQNVFRTFEKKDIDRLEEILGKYLCEVLIVHTDYYMNNANVACLYSINLIIDIVKKNRPNSKVIYCGKLTEMLGVDLLEEHLPKVDVAIRGEAEPVIKTVLEFNYERYKNECVGCLYRKGSDIYSISGTNIIEDYNKLPPIEFDFLNETILELEKIGKDIKALPISIRTSYGCPYSCRFCENTEDWHKYRKKDKRILLSEIRNLKEACNNRLQLVFISDELFTLDIEHIKEVKSVFEDNNIIVNGLFSHVSDITKEKVELLRNITKSIIFGGESSLDSVLNISNKNSSYEKIVESAKLVKSSNIAVGFEWIVGLPNMRVEDYLLDLNNIYKLIACEIVDFIEPYVFVPHPNTYFYNNCRNIGMTICGKNEDMLEEGGFSTVSYKDGLSNKQITVMYLIYRYVIEEAEKAKGHISKNMKAGCVNIEDFKDYIGEFL
ncbi:B12-binding domain-containing radical SAM protein [Pseudobutyrivibrio sp. UC1225]|uniref:B12-binding domain-containing radical SAM protein n=1 Tax=Pseudobutyrivibrio sp. UC1225 TaxID=1798185 RepID=UPI000B8339F4|nr:radical SAM protein [Pseudobutyrivibrio sp. UC1225]